MNILIIDDTKLNHYVATELLMASELDVKITSAHSPEEGIGLLELAHFDILLLDIMMPNYSGLDILKIIKTKFQLNHLKVIMYTSIDKKDKLAECFENGASDYITKPIEEFEFISRVKNAIRQREVELEKDLYIDEIKKQNKIIKEAQIELVNKEKLAGIGQLAAGIAHEINNPLGFVVSNFDILQGYINDLLEGYALFLNLTEKYENKVDQGPLNKQMNDYLYKIDLKFIIEDVKALFGETNVGLERVIKIVKSLRNFSRIDTSEELEPYDINDGIRTTITIAKNSIKYIAEIHTDYGKIPEVEAFGSEINQVLLNMILNSVHAIDELKKKALGVIAIKTFSSENFVYISIKDNGIGMSEAVKGSIFNPFFTTKAVGKGTGLGLSISYDIVVNKHGGDIKVISEVGHGTEFIIAIPIVAERAEESL